MWPHLVSKKILFGLFTQLFVSDQVEHFQKGDLITKSRGAISYHTKENPKHQFNPSQAN